VAVLVEAFTDNRNRTAAEVRLAFGKHGGNLGETGCVGYLFEQRSVVQLAAGDGQAIDEEVLLEGLLALEEQGGPAALSYTPLEEGGLEVFGTFADLEALQDGLRHQGWVVGGWEHRWIPQTACPISDAETLRACLRMLDALEDLEDGRSVTSNLEADEGLMAAVMG
jgi:transcriptional/translational regulatory protein YebC/TACO1